jgi:ubiquinol-cytochrome c reductase cytochrome b subunit
MVALALLVLLFGSGAAMTVYYSPTPGAAYDSVDYAQFRVPFGEVVRGVHVYSWNLLLIVMGVHLGRAFLVAAYRAPWQWTWISAVLVALLLPAFVVTGDLLPWNQSGYWSTQVRLSIVSSVPLVGEFLVALLRGSGHIGVVTLTRFYVLHVLLLPCALLLLLAWHARSVKRGLEGNPSLRDGAPHSWAAILGAVDRGLIVLLVIALVLGWTALQWPAALGDPADPTDTTYVPRPEWWVLALNQLVTIFRGSLMVVGTVIVPGAVAGLLLGLPYLDGSPDRDPARRRRTLGAAVGVAALLLALSVMGYIEHYAAPR